MQPDRWLPEHTSDLLDLLNVLGRLIDLEPERVELLGRICAARLLGRDDLRNAGALPNPEEDGAAPMVADSG